MSTTNSVLIDQKVEVLRARAWKFASISAASAAMSSLVPVAGVLGSIAADFALVSSEIDFYLKTLELDDEALTRTAGYTKSNPIKLISLIHEHFPQSFFTIKLFSLMVSEIGTTVGTSLADDAVGKLAGLIPVVGSAIAASASYGMMVYVLTKILDQMHKVAKDVCEMIIKDAADDL